MGFIPEGAKWYLADIVEEITVGGRSLKNVYINLVLVRADSPEEAYTRALDLGKEGETDYLNSDGETVSFRFRGLRDLNVIHGELEHGTELIYQRREGLSSSEVEKLVTPKKELGVFRPIESRRS